jgi:hypothetical protein
VNQIVELGAAAAADPETTTPKQRYQGIERYWG